METEEKMLNNFVDKYGFHNLVKISNMFLEQMSNQEIANIFGVTRQRVHQWQTAFVQQSVKLRPHVEKALQRVSSRQNSWDN